MLGSVMKSNSFTSLSKVVILYVGLEVKVIKKKRLN
jgi:hypothetical protein